MTRRLRRTGRGRNAQKQAPGPSEDGPQVVNSRAGVLYLVTGDASQHQMLSINRAHLARRHPELRQHVISDRPVAPVVRSSDRPLLLSATHDAGASIGASVAAQSGMTLVEPSPGYASRVYKTQLNQYTPFENTLYLDNDAIVVGPLDELWPCLDQAPVAAAGDICRTIGEGIRLGLRLKQLTQEEAAWTARVCNDNEPYLNAGVILWRKCAATDQLFSLWHREWQRFKRRDQFAFARALSIMRMEVTILRRAYNFPVVRVLKPREIRSARILHFWRPPKLRYMQKLGIVR